MNSQTASQPQFVSAPVGLACVSLSQLPYDMQRLLRVQFKEFVHYLEDLQTGRELVEPMIRCSLAGEPEAA